MDVSSHMFGNSQTTDEHRTLRLPGGWKSKLCYHFQAVTLRRKMAAASSVSSLDMDWNKDMGGTSIWCQNQLLLISKYCTWHNAWMCLPKHTIWKSLPSASVLHGGALGELFKILMSGLMLSAKGLEAHILPVLLSHLHKVSCPFFSTIE